MCCHLKPFSAAATSQDGSSLEFNKAIAGRQCYIQDASSRGLCLQYTNNLAIVSGPSVAVVDCVLQVVAQVLQFSRVHTRGVLWQPCGVTQEVNWVETEIF